MTTVEEINKRIQDEICFDTILQLSDRMLMEEYQNTKSVHRQVSLLKNVLDSHVQDTDVKTLIISEYMKNLIPAGTKGVIRGNKFNLIVKKRILEMGLDPEQYAVCFEKKCDAYVTDEIPDWYVMRKSDNRVLIGMNQLDLWGGGQQINRGSKYVINGEPEENRKLLCVICNPITIKTKNNKQYKLFDTGFRNDTLCYLNRLAPIIHAFFKSF